MSTLQKVEPIEEAFLSVIVYKPNGEEDKAASFTESICKYFISLKEKCLVLCFNKNFFWWHEELPREEERGKLMSLQISSYHRAKY